MKILIVDSWPKTGIGHSILGTARWLAFASLYKIHVKFVFCLPKSTNPLSDLHNEHMFPFCLPSTFDLHDHIKFEGRNLKASMHDIQSIRHVFKKPTRSLMYSLAQNRTENIAFFYPHVREVDSLVSKVEVQRHLQLITYAHKMPKINCVTGLHIRTMHVDSSRCNLFSDYDTCDLIERRKVEKGCTLKYLNKALNKCNTTHRVVVSDWFETYKNVPSWYNIGDHAVVTWNTNHTRQSHKHSFAYTIKAWFVLSSCTSAIIAPVQSQFSFLASFRANVPLHRCC